jgi:hypothetical protein
MRIRNHGTTDWEKKFNNCTSDPERAGGESLAAGPLEGRGEDHPGADVGVVLIAALVLLHVSGEMAVHQADVGGVEAEPDADPALVAQLAHDAGAHRVHRQVADLVHQLHPAGPLQFFATRKRRFKINFFLLWMRSQRKCGGCGSGSGRIGIICAFFVGKPVVDFVNLYHTRYVKMA